MRIDEDDRLTLSMATAQSTGLRNSESPVVAVQVGARSYHRPRGLPRTDFCCAEVMT